MRIFRDLHHRGLCDASVLTIGNFDGLHLGHRALLEKCREVATGGETIAVITFEPLPHAWFNPQAKFARLLGTGQKLRELRFLGVDLIWMMRFNERLATLGARDFIEEILVRGLAARHVVVGEDFRFGHRREGDIELLDSVGEDLGFATHRVPAITHRGRRVSTTRIRRALEEGDLEEARRMLGRPYAIAGRVLPGRQLGRSLGYPTANVRPFQGRSPLGGIFAVRSRAERGPWWDGVANLGTRPAVGGGDLMLEVHLFDYHEELYGAWLETQFLEKIRDEENFGSIDALVAQMKQDEIRARAMLASRSQPQGE